MSIDADVMAAIGSVTGTTPTTTSTAAAVADPEPETAAVDPDVVLRTSGIDRPVPAPKPAPAKPAAGATGESEKTEPADAGELDEDPLDDKHYTKEALNTPEKRAAARAKLFKHLNAVKEMTRKAHRDHGKAAKREEKVTRREEAVDQREAAAAAYDRAFQANLADMESGDMDRFLLGLSRAAKHGDPAGFWRNLSLKLASGGTFTEKEKQQAQADPEIQRRITQLEQVLRGRAVAEEESALEQLKTQNLQQATRNAATPRVVAYASDPRTADATREALANIMVDEHARITRGMSREQAARTPGIDIARACALLEESLAVHYELSQRADGKTNGEKETAGSEPGAGRETSNPPKPDAQPRTIPAQLGASPAAAVRPLTEREQREATVQALEASGFFAKIGM